ncbi:Methyltransferase domain containing protein [Candidatus Methylopumilus planktonicus]|uniref:class I SAM-dependent methyltransferase n=1 Tax=Candidatus Methylopumilus planktonicus TaxID=1581557 RepID=UPI003BEEF4D4
MKSLLIGIAKRVVNNFGFDVVRIRDNFNISQYKFLFTKDELERKPFYNIGAGSFYHPYWTNIDYVSEWYGDLQKNVIHHDLMSKSPLPIGKNKAEIIYTSHVIEHIKEDAVQVLFDEAYRCLKEGGVFRVTAPDAENNFRALINNDENWFYWNRNYAAKGSYESIYHRPANSVPLSERWLHTLASQLAPNDISPSKIKLSDKEIWKAIDKFGFPDVLNYLCGLCHFQNDRPGNHISWWTREKLFKFLTNAGFKNVYQSGFGQSHSPLMRNSKLFDSTHSQVSIYVEAVR